MVFSRKEFCKCVDFFHGEIAEIPLHEPGELTLMWRQDGGVFLRDVPEDCGVEGSSIEDHGAVCADNDTADSFNILRRFGHSRSDHTGIAVFEESENTLSITRGEAVALERVDNEVQRRPPRHDLMTSVHDGENEVDAARFRSESAEDWCTVETVVSPDDRDATILAFVGVWITPEH